ncbi:MAG: hypothetical protein ACYC26_17765 [Phycisphaerales bacterium]
MNTTDSKRILGLDVGGTKSAAIVGDETGRIIDRTEQPSDAHRGPQAMIDMLCNHAETLIAHHGGTGRFRGVGVSIGGPPPLYCMRPVNFAGEPPLRFVEDCPPRPICPATRILRSCFVSVIHHNDFGRTVVCGVE